MLAINTAEVAGLMKGGNCTQPLGGEGWVCRLWGVFRRALLEVTVAPCWSWQLPEGRL